LEDPINSVQLNFTQDRLWILNVCLAFIMFGVALSLEVGHFKEIVRNPRGFLTGIVSQFVLLPAFTFLLILLLKPNPGLALGMILVAACPGGNVSNFYSLIAGGNIALSVSLTGLATVMAVFLTPLNFQIWGSLLPGNSSILNTIQIDFFQMVRTLTLILVIPLVVGLWVKGKFPRLSQKIEKYVRVISFLILAAFIVFALSDNMDVFLSYYQYIVVLVLIHNGLALLVGYLSGKVTRLSSKDIKTITIETGIQNSGLGLVIIFTFFNGFGPMALITAWWGIWHLISGMLIAFLFKRIKTFQPA